MVCIASAALVLLAAGCGPGRKLSSIRRQGLSAAIDIPESSPAPDGGAAGPGAGPVHDTLTVKDEDGREMLIMRAVRDDDTGEMVATEELRAAVVTSRFRNVAERHGKVNLEFLVRVPAAMRDSRWQLRFYPELFMCGDSTELDRLVITGRDYRAAQLRGYQQYERFLSRIVTDTARFVLVHQLEVFLERNLPQIYAFKTDSSYVSDDEFLSRFGVSERQAIDHYTNWLAVSINNRRRDRLGKVWDRCVKAPLETDHIRLDTVMVDGNGDFIYRYVQTVNTRPGLRKAQIVLNGDIWDQDRRVYVMPESDSLTFYISSLSFFADRTERYLTKVVERRLEAEYVCKLDFPAGRHDIDEGFSTNAAEMSRLRTIVRGLLADEAFVTDSITISASASPEGPARMNSILSERRAESVSSCFKAYSDLLLDSLRNEAGLAMTIGGDDFSQMAPVGPELSGIAFRSLSAGENWSMLEDIVAADSLMTETEKDRFRSLCRIDDPDRREAAMRCEPWYPRMRNDIYPRLRTVQFRFHMHRRGMVKDTVHTTEPDTLYRRGVEALSNRDYETALRILAPYSDYNTAVASLSLDRNASAKSILEGCPRTAGVCYLLAVLYSRMGEDRPALECYLESCRMDPGYVSRGNLDPEISQLKTKYRL